MYRVPLKKLCLGFYIVLKRTPSRYNYLKLTMGQYKQIFKNYQDAANIVELNLNKNIAKFFLIF